MALTSFTFTLGFLTSRAPQLTRPLRLGLYLALSLGYLHLSRQLATYTTKKQYDEVTLKVLEPNEVKKLRRAWQIKKAEAEEEKKALAKYKYDP